MTENTRNIKDGDFVTITTNAQGTAWDSGKIMGIWPDGTFLIGFGGKHMSDDLRIFGTRRHIKAEEIGEVWRKTAFKRAGSFTTPDGKTLHFTENTFDWKQVE